VSAHDDLAYLTATELAQLYRSRRLSPVEMAEASLTRIAQLDPKLNSYITVTAERAREQAKAAEGRYVRGAPHSALDGVPFAPKDIFATRGVRTTHGSKLGADHLPAETATAVERLETAGGVMLGKLNLLEFATGSGTESGFGPTRNPWDLARDPGGSSSGSGAALAAGMATLSLGTDTGGSIRNPAARCGIVGLKPTYGRVSRDGVTPLAWTLDHAGPMARNVRDAACLLRVLAGHDPKDASSAREPVPDYEAALSGRPSLAGRRFAVARQLLDPLEPEVRTVFEAALGQLESLGARSAAASLPSVPAMNIACEVLIGAEAAVYHEQNLRHKERRALIDPAVRMYATSGRFYMATDYVKAQRLRLQLQAELEGALAEADVLVCPSDPTLTPKVGEAARLAGRERMWFEYGTVNLGNLTGAPAISIPCGFTPDGMPVGLQLYGRAFDEATVLSFAHAYERTTDWHRRRPPLAGLQEVASGGGREGGLAPPL
jgi:aspartyl-tRNA(Asn)/glutamyl-tRNA(Gln) amidotransferase subunit A